MQITGDVSVVIDAVDVEQALMRNSVLARPVFNIIDAALAKETMQSLSRFCLRTKHTLEYLSANQVNGAEKWSVTFRIRPKTHNEMIAKECGL